MYCNYPSNDIYVHRNVKFGYGWLWTDQSDHVLKMSAWCLVTVELRVWTNQTSNFYFIRQSEPILSMATLGYTRTCVLAFSYVHRNVIFDWSPGEHPAFWLVPGDISSGKVFTCEHHIRKCSHMNIIYGFFWKLHFSKNVRIWSYTVRHMIIELNHMWDSYTTPDYLHIPNPKMFTCEIIYEHHIP